MAQSVTLTTGKQPQYFTFGPPGFTTIPVEQLTSISGPPGSYINQGNTLVQLGSARVYTTTTIQASNPLYQDTVYHSYQLVVTGTTATAQMQVSNEDATGQGIPGLVQLNSSVTAQLTSAPIPYNTYLQAPAIITGMLAVGPGIPAGTTITVSGSTITLSNAATITAAQVPVMFYSTNWINLGAAITSTPGTPAGLVDTSSWKYVRANVTAITGTAYIILGA